MLKNLKNIENARQSKIFWKSGKNLENERDSKWVKWSEGDHGRPIKSQWKPVKSQ